MAGRSPARVAALLIAGCSGNQLQGQVYRDEKVAFHIGTIPSSWRRIEADRADLAFRDDAAGVTVAVSSRCGKDGDDVPLKALTHHLFLHFTDRRVISQTMVPLDGREAMRTTMVAELDGVPKHYTTYVLKKDGCVYDFIHIAALSAPKESQQHFTRFVEGFSTLR